MVKSAPKLGEQTIGQLLSLLGGRRELGQELDQVLEQKLIVVHYARAGRIEKGQEGLVVVESQGLDVANEVRGRLGVEISWGIGVFCLGSECLLDGLVEI